MTAPRAGNLLSVRQLTVTFPLPSGEEAKAVDGISFDVAPGEIVALVGESGCGKSVTTIALLDLVPAP
ncbi:MAG TPA: ATP-binding cassette domain-containing protein, partial [Thermoanaerobaculia bacterium]|nr:ATP-binding cassette domain-containing protein [Thermoanaerobaculia bacterium]